MRITEEGATYALDAESLETLRLIYLLLITDDGTPRHAIKGDKRRDLAQRMGCVLDRFFKLP